MEMNGLSIGTRQVIVANCFQIVCNCRALIHQLESFCLRRMRTETDIGQEDDWLTVFLSYDPVLWVFFQAFVES
jgi:hypothetical protein